ncbi:AzlC family ABC transporter permease [Halopenitus sp. H-Gu1]|uniref:AzlC family ABC transporter permease n=1 Tax=Halopenitus sp. H-Gu1 TaxID=3242697 RepID=UPI00359EB0B5
MNADLRSGVRDSLPLLLGIVPFSMVTGIAAIDAGLTPAQAIGMSVVIYAGASQIAAADLLGETAPLAVVVFTAVVINLRLVMYSVSIAPHFATYRRRTRGYMAYLLTDPAYALSVTKYETGDVDDKRAYYLGIGVTIWVVWLISTALGVVIGTTVPEKWGLSFAVPLVFLAILVPLLTDRSRTIAAFVGGGVAVLAAGVPFNLSLPIGAIAGIAAGLASGAVSDR